jgi:hypothetical protein
MAQDPEEMERLKAEWNRSVAGGRAHAWNPRRILTAVFSDVVSGVVMITAFALAAAMVIGAFLLMAGAGRAGGRLAFFSIFPAALVIRGAWSFVLWWRRRTGRQ